MNCRNCGAAMELYERRRYYYCAYCGTFHFIDTPEVDGIVPLGRSDATRQCPLCKVPLAKALLDDHFSVRQCRQCHGVLMTRTTFADALTRRRASATGPGVPPTPLDRRELARVVACPSCGRDMDVHPYYGPGNVIIDSCVRCDLIWLDRAELKQMTDAPGRDRGTRD